MQPALFLAHGSPLIALEGGPYALALQAAGVALRGARAILVVSPRWETRGLRLTAGAVPGVIHDFEGVLEPLGKLGYGAPGDPELAWDLAESLSQRGFPATLESSRGLDHGAWVPLRALRPAADLPVLQLSLPQDRSPDTLAALGRVLRPWREKGLVLVGTGGIVHNPQQTTADGHLEPWALAFDGWFQDRLAAGAWDVVRRAGEMGPYAAQAVPNPASLAPFYVAAGSAGESRPEILVEGWQHGTLSLRSFRWTA